MVSATQGTHVSAMLGLRYTFCPALPGGGTNDEAQAMRKLSAQRN